MKRAIIVHCWGGSPHYAWYPWAKARLDELGYVTVIPEMPNTHEPQFKQWLDYLTQTIGEPDEELVLIGHSLGTVTILRYLETLADNQRISKAILVAAFTDQLGFRELENFFYQPIDYKKIRSKPAHGFVAIQSDNDPYVSNQYGDRLREELSAGLIIKHGAEHMSGALDAEGACLELPDVINALP